MTLTTTQPVTGKWAHRGLLPLGAAGVGGAAVLLGGHPLWLLGLAGVAACFVLAFVCFRRPGVFLGIFLVLLLAFPPLYFDRLGDIPIYVPILLAPIGWAILVSRLGASRLTSDPVARGLMIFLWSLALSLPLAFYFSGVAIGAQSLLRWILLSHACLVYFLIRSKAVGAVKSLAGWLIPALLVAAVVSALYGIVDFYWPVPLPHPAADQYVWMQAAVLRRAQGVFYEAMSFGNLCGFFLVVTSLGFFASRERDLGFRRLGTLMFIGIFTLAVFLAFSRSVWASVLVTLLIFFFVYRPIRFSRVLGVFLVTGICFILILVYATELWNYFLSARVGDLALLFADPNLASSGRFATWSRVLTIMQSHPLYLLLGVGFKTLPYTRLFHDEIITDNGFLNLLLETGIMGLAGFVTFSVAVWRKFLSLARKSEGAARFWSALIVSFWCGEWVQMLAVDAYTFWRNMIVFVAFMAMALNMAEREEFRADTYPA